MDDENIPLDANFDPKLNSELTVDQPDALGDDETHIMRLVRIEEYREEALRHPSYHLANLGSVKANLMFIEEKVATAIKNELATQHPTIELMEQINPTVNMYLHLTGQIGRYTVLETAIASSDVVDSGRPSTSRGRLVHSHADNHGRRAR